MIKATYRTALPHDVKDIYEMLLEMHKEIALANLDDAKAIMFIEGVVSDGICYLAHVGDVLVGSIGLGPQQFWYSSDWFLGDYWTFVREGYRKSRIASDLLVRAKEFSDGIDIPIAVGVFSKGDVPRKNKLFRRHFTPVGEMFVEGF